MNDLSDQTVERIGQLLTAYLDVLAENRRPGLEPWLRESNGIILAGIRSDLRGLGVDTGFIFDWRAR